MLDVLGTNFHTSGLSNSETSSCLAPIHEDPVMDTLGANGLVKVSLENFASSSLSGCSTFVVLIGVVVFLLFCEVLGEGASSSIAVKEEALAVSATGRVTTEFVDDTLLGDDKFPVIIAKDLSVEEKTALITVLKSHKRAIAWKLSDIKGTDPKFCTHKILMEDDFEPAVQHQRRVNPKIHDVIKNEVLKLLNAGLIYLISDSPWVSPVHYVPKKGGFTVVENEENELIPTRLVTGWCVSIDYQKLNEVTRKDHFTLPFMDQMLERLAGNEYYCFMMVSWGIFKFPSIQKIKKIPHSLVHTERLPTFACLLGYAMHRVFGDSFQTCLSHLEKILKRCEDTNLCLNWEKSHFTIKEGIVLGHKISKNGIEVDKAKVEVIAKSPHPTTIKGIRSFLGHAGFYRRFIKDF
nr:reverse transcriptase domain-containing protein [Tanacetum cinerariifolium]